MAVMVLLPDEPPAGESPDRLKDYLAFHFGAEARIRYRASAASFEIWAGLIPGVERESAPGGDDCLVHVQRPGMADLPSWLSAFRNTHAVYSINEHGQLIDCSAADPGASDPHRDTHIFNRLGPSYGPFGSYFYFPYGYTYRFPGMGPINAFGFRVPEDLGHLAARGDHHKVIALFGGSAAWDMFAIESESFAVLLESGLNAQAQAQGSPLSFTVLNFGQHGHVLLNEMMTYLLFVEALRPDVVIAHDGFNDLAYGAATDPALLSQWAITYQTNLEAWAQKLHDSKAGDFTQPNAPPFEPINLPHAIIRAYLIRKLQFHDLASSRGAAFVWGTQPAVFSKQAPSPVEEALGQPSRDPAFQFRSLYQKMPFLYEQLGRVALPERVVHTVDFNAQFQAYGADSTLFCDVVHQNREGNEIIAARYQQEIASMLLAGEREST